MPARNVRNDGPGTLVLESPVGKGTDVALTRRYSWIRPGVLSCRVDWIEILPDGRQAIQIFQLENPDAIVARQRISPALPMGCLQLPLRERAGVRKHFEKPPHAKAVGKDTFLTRQSTEEKLGFPVQSLRALWPHVELILHSGTITGMVTGETDGGCRSQVYLGSDEWPVVEIEQLSPRLGPGKNSDTVEVELLRR